MSRKRLLHKDFGDLVACHLDVYAICRTIHAYTLKVVEDRSCGCLGINVADTAVAVHLEPRRLVGVKIVIECQFDTLGDGGADVIGIIFQLGSLARFDRFVVYAVINCGPVGCGNLKFAEQSFGQRQFVDVFAGSVFSRQS